MTMTERADALSRPRLCLYIVLFRQESGGRRVFFDFCGAIPVRGGVLKSTLVVDNDRQCTMYIRTQSLSVHQSWSSVVSVLTISDADAPHEWLKKTIHGI